MEDKIRKAILDIEKKIDSIYDVTFATSIQQSIIQSEINLLGRLLDSESELYKELEKVNKKNMEKSFEMVGFSYNAIKGKME